MRGTWAKIGLVTVCVWITLLVPVMCMGASVDELISQWQDVWEKRVEPNEVIEMVKASRDEAVVRLVGMLDGTALSTAEFAVDGLKRLVGDAALDRLVVELVGAEEAELRARAAKALGVLYRPDLVTQLLTHLQFERNYSSIQMLKVGRELRALLVPSEVSLEEAVSTLARTLGDPVPDVRRSAVWALSELITDDRVARVLRDALAREPVPIGEVVALAAEVVSLEEVDLIQAWVSVVEVTGASTDAVPGLLVWVAHPVLEVALSAAKAASKAAGDERVEALLLAGLDHEEAPVRWAAATALGAVAIGLDTPVLRSIGGLELSATDVAETLALRLGDSDVKVRRAVVQALERWVGLGVAMAADRLASIGRDESEPEDSRAAALRLLAGTTAELSPTEAELAAMYELRPVFSRGTEGYHTFRIPSLLVSPRGTLLMFAEGRKSSQSDSGDIDLVLKRSLDKGRTWEPLQIVWDAGPNTAGNPVPVVDEETGRIWLFMTHNLGVDTQARIQNGTSQGVRTIWATYSDDDGVTWAEPIDLSGQVQSPGTRWDATGPAVGIQLRHGPQRGRLVIPAIGRIIYSDDHGATWHQGGRVEGTSESQVVELTDGRLLRNDRAVARSVPNRRPLSYSNDQGMSWSRPRYARELITTYSQGSTVRYKPSDDPSNDRTLLFSNPATEVNVDKVTGAKGHGARVNMTVRVSRDEGDTWSAGKTIHPGPSGYSSLAVLPDETIALAFEGGRKHTYEHIYFVRFSLDWLEDGR